MVNLKEIIEVLKKLKTNIEKLKYLNKILGEVDDKNLKKQIKELMEDIKELEAVAQVETRGKVDWSLPEEEPKEERRLERQVISIPLPRGEEEEKKIEYGISHSDITYAPRGMDEKYIHSKIITSLEHENLAFTENLPITEDQKDLIEKRVRDYMPTATEERIQEETSSIINEFRYETHQEAKGYASVSHELHERARKKPLH